MTPASDDAQDRAPILVMKFGGTSIGSVDAIQQAGAIVRQSLDDWPRTVVVVSALSGVTNLLLDTAVKATKGDRNAGEAAAGHLRTRHLEVARVLISDDSAYESLSAEIESLTQEFSHLCGAIAVLGEATPRALDAVASIGERLSVRLFASVLNEIGVATRALDAAKIVVTDSSFQSAHPDLPATRLRSSRALLPLLEEGIVPVVTGFVGADPAGVTTTLGRGGSDYSAALVAAALDAVEVWIWTDVDGVMTADPRIVPEARTIATLSYRELAELAYFGAKVLHPMTIRPVVEAGIGLSIRNTFNANHPGTRLVTRNHHSTEVMKAVTSIKGQNLITIEGRGMLGVPGVAARTFAAVAATGTNVILISQASSEQSICFAVPAAKSGLVVRSLEEAFSRELHDRDIDRVRDSGEVVIVTVVGAGMRHTPGVAGRVFTALGADGVNVVAIAQGSSEVAISLVVEAGDEEPAVRALHRLVG
jgi:bifunctional aspartokinase / homoserine dehydrogenase 1